MSMDFFALDGRAKRFRNIAEKSSLKSIRFLMIEYSTQKATRNLTVFLENSGRFQKKIER